MVLILLIVSIILNIVIFYGAYNCVKKNEIMEQEIFILQERIEYFYLSTSNILKECRDLDKREMFEKDDEVGILFQHLIEVIGELRNIIYDTNEEKET